MDEAEGWRGRPRRKLDEQKQGVRVLERLKKEPAGWRRERRLAIKMGLEGGQTHEQVAAAVGHARSTVQEWFALSRADGIEALLSLHRGKGPASRLSAEAAAALRAGLEAGRWRPAGPVRAFLAQEHGWEASRTSTSHYWGKMRRAAAGSAPGASQKRPREK